MKLCPELTATLIGVSLSITAHAATRTFLNA